MSMIQQYQESYFKNHGYGNQCLMRYDLDYVGGGSDKVYIIRVVDQGNNQIECQMFWGRRGSTLQHKIDLSSDYARAISTAARTKQEKENKGYILQYTGNPSQSGAGNSTAPSNIPEIYSLTLDIPQFINVPSLVPYITDENYAFERLDSIGNLYYIVPYHKEWHIFDMMKQPVNRRPAPGATNYAYMNAIEKYVFLAQFDKLYHYSVFDFVYSGGSLFNDNYIPDLNKKDWRQRRVMMTQIFGDLYPKRDIYDKSLSFHLNDYAYDEKEKADMLKKTAGLIMARNITEPFNRKIKYQRVV